MTEAFLTGLVAGYGIAIPVGAIAVLIIQTGIRYGFRASFAAGAGAATADLLYAGLAAVGGGKLSRLVGSFGGQGRILSAVVLVAIAIMNLWNLRARPSPHQATAVLGRKDLVRTYGRFFALTVVNPATVVYFVAVVVGLGIANNMTAAEGIAFVAGAFAASFSWQTVLAGAGAVAGKRLSKRVQTLAVILGNLLILALATAILVR